MKDLNLLDMRQQVNQTWAPRSWLAVSEPGSSMFSDLVTSREQYWMRPDVDEKVAALFKHMCNCFNISDRLAHILKPVFLR